MEKPGRTLYGPVNGLSKTQEKRRRRRKYPNVFFKKEMLAAFDAIDNPRTMMGAFLAFICALRISEVCKLQWMDIDLQEARLKVVDGKNHKDGFIPISPVALPILQKWRQMNPDEKYVLPSEKYGTGFYQATSLLKDFRKALAKAGLEIATDRNAAGNQQHQYKFHTLRHSRCTHLLSNGVPLEKVQKFMRHDKIETTMTYTWILDKELNRMVQKVDTGLDELAPAAVPVVADRPAANPLAIAQKRLACGELSIREYQKIARALTAT